MPDVACSNIYSYGVPSGLPTVSKYPHTLNEGQRFSRSRLKAADNVLRQGENWIVGTASISLRARVEHDVLALIRVRLSAIALLS